MQETTIHNAEIERISRRIKELADEHFLRGELRFFLSNLGSLLSNDRLVLEKLSGRKLADFVTNVLHYKVGRSGQHLNVLYIIRPDEFGAPTEVQERKLAKFGPKIWSAFATPLTVDERRYFNPETQQLSSEPSPDEASLEIPSTLISDGTFPAHIIASNIRTWIKDQKLDISQFVATRALRSTGRTTLLRQLLETLTHEQLRRALLPLDIIKSLSEHHDV